MDWGRKEVYFTGEELGGKKCKYVEHANNFNINHVRRYPDNIYKRAAKVAGHGAAPKWLCFGRGPDPSSFSTVLRFGGKPGTQGTSPQTLLEAET